MPRLLALSRFWAQSPPPHMLLRLIAETLGVKPRDGAAAVDPAAAWTDLREAGADPASGLAIRGKPPF